MKRILSSCRVVVGTFEGLYDVLYSNDEKYYADEEKRTNLSTVYDIMWGSIYKS